MHRLYPSPCRVPIQKEHTEEHCTITIIADLRHKKKRTRLALSYSRGMQNYILKLTKQSKSQFMFELWDGATQDFCEGSDYQGRGGRWKYTGHKLELLTKLDIEHFRKSRERSSRSIYHRTYVCGPYASCVTGTMDKCTPYGLIPA